MKTVKLYDAVGHYVADVQIPDQNPPIDIVFYDDGAGQKAYKYLTNVAYEQATTYTAPPAE